jgi:formyltetrahydrofolate synthetase
VTESGFGADCGFTKLVNIGCRQSGIKLDAAVVVASVRALKQHGGAFHLHPGAPYSRIKEAAETENLPALEKGCENLRRSVEIVKEHGVKVVVAVNTFTSDTDKEIELVRKMALEYGADGVAVSEAWAKGGEGSLELADAVLKALETPSEMKFTFPDDMSIEDKIRTVAQKVHLADDIEITPAARKKLKLYQELGFDWMSVNMAKTHLSLSHDPNWLGVPEHYTMPIRDIRASVGAGFVYPICGTMLTMPGLPSRPAFMDVDIDTETGKITGLF